MKNGLKLLTYLVIISTACGSLFGQKTNDFAIRGSLGLGGDIYSVNGIEDRRSPFSYYLRGSVALSYKEFSVPISVAYSNQQFSYGYTLNRIGIRPTYKWIKGHLGWSEMQFSPYVMSRKQFLGAGVELNPGKVRFAAFYGILENPAAIQDTILYGAVLLPNFQRKAMGAKLGYGSSRNFFEFSVLSGRDDLENPTGDNPNQITVVPEDNLVVGARFKFTLLKSLSLESNTALSGLTKDKFSDEVDLGSFEFVSGYLTPTNSTRVSLAGDVRLRYIIRGQAIGLEYRRIEPTFRSYGVPFLQTDIQSYLGFVNLNMFKSKVSLNLQGGIQRNNLRNNRAVQTNRFIANANLNWRINKQVMANVMHSNFTNNTEPGVLELSDTLRFAMSTAMSGVFLRFSSEAKEDKWTVSANVNRQNITDLSPVKRIQSDIQNWQASLSIGKNFDAITSKVKGSLLYSKYDGSFDSQKRYGGGIGLGKIFNEVLSLDLDTRYYRNDIQAFSNGYVITSQFVTSWNFTKTQSLSLRTVYINKKSAISRDFKELRAGISYNIRF